MHVEGRDIWLPIVANLARRKVIVGLSWHIFVPRPQCQKPNRKCLGVFDQPLSDWTSYDLHLIWCWLVTGLSSKTSSSVQRGRRGLQNGRVVSKNCHEKLDCLALSWFLCFLKNWFYNLPLKTTIFGAKFQTRIYLTWGDNSDFLFDSTQVWKRWIFG